MKQTRQQILSLFLCVALLLSLFSCLSGCRQRPPVSSRPGRAQITSAEAEKLLQKVSVDFPEGTITQAELDIALTEDAPPLFDAEMLVFDINMKSYEESSAGFDLRLPYDQFDFGGGSPSGLIFPAYLNPDSDSWEPVIFDLDETRKEVVIHTNHFSRYGVMNIYRSATPEAYVAFYTESSALFRLAEQMSLFDSINLVSTVTREKWSLETGEKIWKLFETSQNWFSGTTTTGGYLAEQSNQHADAKFFETGGKWLTYVGYFTGLWNIAKNSLKFYSDGEWGSLEQYRESARETYSFIATSAVGLAASSLAGVLLMAGPLVEGMIDTAGDTIYKNEKDFYRQLFDIYYETQGRSLQDWATFIRVNRERVGNDALLRRVLNEEIERYCREFWQNENNWLAVMMEDPDFSRRFGGAFRAAELSDASVNQKMKKEISAQYEQYFRQKILPKILAEVCEQDMNELEKKVRLALTKLMGQLNAVNTIEIADGTVDGNAGERSEYANAKVYLLSEEDMDPIETWSMTLNESGRGKFSYRLIGYITDNSPDLIAVYKEGRDPETDEPDQTFPYDIEEKDTPLDFYTIEVYEEWLRAPASPKGRRDVFALKGRVRGDYPSLDEIEDYLPEEGLPKFAKIITYECSPPNELARRVKRNEYLTLDLAPLPNFADATRRQQSYQSAESANCGFSVRNADGTFELVTWGTYDPSTGVYKGQAHTSAGYIKALYPKLEEYRDEITFEINFRYNQYDLAEDSGSPTGSRPQIHVTGSFAYRHIFKTPANGPNPAHDEDVAIAGYFVGNY